MISQGEKYEQLVEERKACRRCVGLVNPSEVADGAYDSRELGPWTAWQGSLTARLIVVGQDFSDVDYFVRNRGRDEAGNPTNAALAELLKGIGRAVGDGSLFFTNAILCLKKQGGMQGAVSKEWFTECGARFLKRTIELVAPKAVAPLGERAYQAICSTYGMPVLRPYRRAVESREFGRLGEHSRLVPVYHCGKRIQNTVRTIDEQKEDWARVREALDAD